MDIRTVFLAGPILGLLLTAVLVYVWRTRETYPGFGYAVLQYVGVTMGVHCLSLRGPSVPSFVPVLIGSGLLLAGALLALQGVKTFFGRGRMHQGHWAALALVELVLAWFLYVSPNLSIRIMFTSFFLGVTCLLSPVSWYSVRPSRCAPPRVLPRRS